MAIPFLIKALALEPFAPLINLTDHELTALGAKWLPVHSAPGYPCRVSLTDAAVGERVLALCYTHHNVQSAYRAAGPIFIREHASMATLAVNEVPLMLRHRLLSVRAYDHNAMMIGAEVLPGEELEAAIERLFQNTAVQYLHIHNAKPGCYNCSVQRV